MRRQAQRSYGAAIAHLSELSMSSEFWKISAQTSSFLLAQPADSGHSSFVRDKRKNKGVPLCLADASLHVFPCVSDSGCRSLAVLFEEGLIQSLHYPEDYNDMANCNWVFQAPKHYLIKVLTLAPLPLPWYLHRIANRSTTGQLFYLIYSLL